jgi:PAS domain S-box-containing protein
VVLSRLRGAEVEVVRSVPPHEPSEHEAAREALLRRLVDASDTADTLRAVCEETARALRVPFVTLRGIDPGTGLTTSAYTHGAPPGFAPIPADPSARAAFLARHGDVAAFVDIARVLELPGGASLVEAGVRSLAHARLVARGATIGLLLVATFGEERVFDARDLAFLRSVANLAAVALATARVHERYRYIVTAMSEGVLVADGHGRIVFASPAAERLFEGGADVLLGRRLDDLVPTGDPPLPEVRAAREPVPPRTTRRLHTLAGREVWVSFVRLAFEAPGEAPGSLTILADVTESRRLEERHEQMRRAESLGVLAGGIAHDFNNLLVGILANAGLVREAVPPHHVAREALADIEGAARRASELTQQLLAYAGKGHFVLSILDPAALAREVVAQLRGSVPERIALACETGAVPNVQGAEPQLRQVLVELITNAVEAMGARPGRVSVRVSASELSADDVAHLRGDTASAGRHVLLEVVDAGDGMSGETLAHLFEPFYSTKFQGRGLGLATTLGVLRAHRGAIDVRSTPGHGTHVRVFLPAASSTPTTAASNPPRPATDGGTILVVDDEESVRRVIRRVLERAGHHVVLACDGEEAIAILRERPEGFRAVVLDLTMPKMSGEQTLAELRAISPHVPVVLVSGFSESEATSHFAEKGIAAFLPKPFSVEELKAAIARAGTSTTA